MEEEAEGVVELGDASGVAVEQEDHMRGVALIVELAEAVAVREGLDLQLVARRRLGRQLAAHRVIGAHEQHRRRIQRTRWFPGQA